MCENPDSIAITLTDSELVNRWASNMERILDLISPDLYEELDDPEQDLVDGLRGHLAEYRNREAADIRNAEYADRWAAAWTGDNVSTRRIY